MDEDDFRDISARNIFWTFAPNQIFCTQTNNLPTTSNFLPHPPTQLRLTKKCHLRTRTDISLIMVGTRNVCEHKSIEKSFILIGDSILNPVTRVN